MTTESTIMIEKNTSNWKVYEISMRGAIFCHVNNIRLFIQLSPSMTPGNQKWKGAAPIFSKRELLINVFITIKLGELGTEGLNNKDPKITESKSVAEARACTKKYFNDASVENKFFELVIKGIKESKLISKPIHAPNHELAEVEIKVPPINVNKNKNLVGLLIIREKGVKPL